MKIQFLGATGTVTGSKYLLTVNGTRILLDCGLFQGHKELRLRNWDKLPIKPSLIDAVVITHAHIDHTGYIPLLVKNGFKGPIYATSATCDLCKILLPDSGYLNEEEAKRANRYSYSKHSPALPLYTELDAENALKQFKPVGFDKSIKIANQIDVSWHNAGHILGSALVKFIVGGKIIVFTGDIGRQNDSLLLPPALIEEADYLITVSTYGNRLHDKKNPEEDIANAINQTAKRGGTIVIPAFAVGRAQTILYYISKLKDANKIPDLPVFLDSPMAIDATDIFCKHEQWRKMTASECHHFNGVATYVNTRDESKALVNNAFPKIIISASGMMTGGRILHHLKQFMPDYKSTILLTGFQAAGTRGDRLLKGEREIKIHGKMHQVKAQITSITNLSAHADHEEIVTWLKGFKRPPKKVFITHGEPEAASSLKSKIEKQFYWNCSIPKYLDEEELT